MATACRVRVEWGGLTSYLDKGRFEYNWDGGVAVKNGRIRALYQIHAKDLGHCFSAEKWIPLPGPTWQSRTNNGLSGIILELDGDRQTEIVVTTTQKQIKFKLGELRSRKCRRWPVGAKYAGIVMLAMLEGEGPFDINGSVARGCMDIRVRHDAFRGAARYGLFNTVQAAWIEPGKSVEAQVELPRAPVMAAARKSAFILELRLSLARSLEIGSVDTSRYSPFEVAVNGRILTCPSVYFRTEETCWKGDCQWIEFVTIPVPAECLQAGSNRIRVRNGSPADILTLVSAQLREEIRTDGQIVSAPRWALAGEDFDIVVRCLAAHDHIRAICRNAAIRSTLTALASGEQRLTFQAGSESQPAVISLKSGGRTLFRSRIPVFNVPPEPIPWKVGGTFQGVRMDESNEIEHFVDYVRDTQMGNYLQFRPETSCPYRCNANAARMEDWRRWGRLLKERRMFVSMMGAHDFKNYNMDNIEPDPMFYEKCRRLKEGSGDYFFSTHVHEYSRWIYGGLPGKDAVLAPDENTMQAACRRYVEAVAALEGLEGVPRQGGQAAPLMAYDFEGGMDYIAVETMALNTMHLFAAMRGAARAYGKKIWGTHNATYWCKAPDDFTKLGLNYLNWYLTYMAGGNFVISEDGHYTVPHNGRQQGFHSEGPSLLREQIRQFYRYVNTHPRSGAPEVKIAVAQGNLSGELISFPLKFAGAKECIGRVWGKMGAPTPEWAYGDPERGMELLDVFMPYWQDGAHIRHWFTGTPYGAFDLTPIWKAGPELLATYKLLVFLGWNTMTPEIYRKLMHYVEGGGTLFMAVPHLFTRADRRFLPELPNVDVIQNGDCRDLFGVKIKGPTSKPAGRAVWNQSGDDHDRIIRYAARRYAPAPKLAEVELDGDVRVLMADEKENRPILVERRMGKGRALLLTAWAYPGHAACQPLARDILHLLAEETQHQSAWRVEDHSGEVVNVCWKKPSGLHTLYLLNTDWTKAGNVKSVLVHVGRHTLPVEVPERRMTTVTWRHKVAVLPHAPDIYVQDIVANGKDECRLVLHGSRKGRLALYGLGVRIKDVLPDGKKLGITSMHNTAGVVCAVDFTRCTRQELIVRKQLDDRHVPGG